MQEVEERMVEGEEKLRNSFRSRERKSERV
jgi:hypothetical protein